MKEFMYLVGLTWCCMCLVGCKMKDQSQRYLRFIDRTYTHADESIFLRMNDGYMLPIQTRAHLYGGGFGRTLILEHCHYHNRNYRVEVMLLIYQWPSLSSKGSFRLTVPAIPITESEFERLEDPDLVEFIRRDADTIWARGERLEVPLARELYQSAGIDLAVVDGANRAEFVDLARLLAWQRPDLFWISEADLRQFVPGEQEKLAVIKDWNHQDEMIPSEQAAYQEMVQILVAGEVLGEVKLPAGNLHWRNWGEAGHL